MPAAALNQMTNMEGMKDEAEEAYEGGEGLIRGKQTDKKGQGKAKFKSANARLLPRNPLSRHSTLVCVSTPRAEKEGEGEAVGEERRKKKTELTLLNERRSKPQPPNLRAKG